MCYIRNKHMTKKRNAQELSINTIILAVLGLIILVVLVALLTGRLGGFSKGIGEASSCEKLCEVILKSKTAYDTKDLCEDAGGDYRSGNFDDVTSGVCCCT